MSVLTHHLKLEHKTILEALEILEVFRQQLDSETDFNPSNLRLLIFMLHDLVEDTHHAKEELHLFPAMEASGRLNQGGPRCTYFMELHLQDQFERSIKQRDESLLLPIGLSDSLQTFDKPSSPLNIPLEEHQIGHNLLLHIRLELDRISNDPSRRSVLSRRILEYDRLLRLHIEKEDTCLFVLADQIIPDERQAAILKKIEADLNSHQVGKKPTYTDILNKLKQVIASSNNTARPGGDFK